MSSVAIIGGGITGLATAYYLENSPNPPERIVLFESDSKVGGKIQTKRYGECVIEEGPDSILLKADSPLDNLLTALNLRESFLSPQKRSFMVQRDGILHEVPLGILRGFPHNALAMWNCSLISYRGKMIAGLRLLLDLLHREPELAGDPSIAEVLRGRYGKELSQHLFETIFGGIHSGEASRLSLKSLYPEMARRTRLKKPKGASKGKHHMARFISFRDGMSVLPQAIVQALTRTEICHDTVLSVTSDATSYLLRTSAGMLEADAVVCATPAFTTAELLQEEAPELATLLRRIKHGSSAIVTSIIPKSEITKMPIGSGYLLSSQEPGTISGCTYSSEKWSDRAPQDTLIIRTFLGRNGGLSNLSEDDLRECAIEEMAKKHNIRSESFPHFVKTWHHGAPQYLCGHEKLLSEIENARMRKGGIYLTGASYRGVGIPDCVRQAQEAATEVLRSTESISKSSLQCAASL
jgi:oxygen-dependent protoporphyrinogen oxidase